MTTWTQKENSMIAICDEWFAQVSEMQCFNNTESY